MERVNVLDKFGFVDLIDHLGTDLSVVNSARVSFNKRSEVLNEQDIRLLNYLAKHNHFSPFTHAVVSYRIRAPISVQRQLFKHQVGVSNNSESTRYVKIEPEFYVPEHLRLQSKNKKQGSEGTMKDSCYEYQLLDRIVDTNYSQYMLYKELLEAGVANETARDVLPLSTYTTWVSTMSLYAIYNLFRQRTGEGAQDEVQQYAYAIQQLTEPLYPHSWKSLVESDTK